MKRYTHIVLRRMPPLNGFSIKTTEGKFLSDIRPRGIVRELNRLNDRIKRLEAVVNDPHALWANWLRGDVKLPEGIGDVRQYQDRIKRLEEAGDDLYANCDPSRWDSAATAARKLSDQNAWLKAKEAK